MCYPNIMTNPEKIMFKKISLAVLISCISVSSYANVKTNFIIENKTNVDMVFTAKQPNNQDDITQVIPANDTRSVYMTDGLSDWWLYQSHTASFKIGERIKNDEMGKLYVKGRIAYYTGSAYWNRYTFLDAISVADGLKVDPSYYCGTLGFGHPLLDNKIIINGTPGNILIEKDFPQPVTCHGLKSSVLVNHEDPSTPQYTPTCFDYINTSYFFGKMEYQGCASGDITGETCQTILRYTNIDSGNSTRVIINDVHVDAQRLQAELDKQVGNPFCETWSFK